MIDNNVPAWEGEGPRLFWMIMTDRHAQTLLLGLSADRTCFCCLQQQKSFEHQSKVATALGENFTASSHAYKKKKQKTHNFGLWHIAIRKACCIACSQTLKAMH